jgi:hypothetical protein
MIYHLIWTTFFYMAFLPRLIHITNSYEQKPTEISSRISQAFDSFLFSYWYLVFVTEVLLLDNYDLGVI